MAFADRFRRRLNPADINGFAGGSLQDQLNQDPRMIRTPPAPIESNDRPPIEGTPEWQAAMSRAVPVRANEIPQPAETMSDPNASRQRAVSFNAQTGQPNEDFYRDRGDISALYNAEQNWKPHGGKRSLKNSLKSGAMYAAEAVRNNPNDPVTAAIAGFGIGAGGGTAAPNFGNRLTRQWKLGQVGGELQNQLKLQGEQAKIDSLQNKPQIQAQQQQEREINNALTQYNRLEHYDPDDPADAGLKTYLESRGLRLPKKDKYHRPIASWVNGQLVLTDSSGTHGAEMDGQPLVDQGRVPNEQGLTPNQAAIQGSNEANRGATRERFTEAEKGRNDRFNQREGRVGARGAAGTPRPPSDAKIAKANSLVARYNLMRKQEMASDVAPEDKSTLKARREALWQQVMGTYPGMFEANAQGELQPKVAGATVNTELMPAKSDYVVPKNVAGRKWSKAAFGRAHSNLSAAQVDEAAKAMSEAGAQVVP